MDGPPAGSRMLTWTGCCPFGEVLPSCSKCGSDSAPTQMERVWLDLVADWELEQRKETVHDKRRTAR